MKIVLSIICVILGSLICQYFLPWWIVGLVSFVVCYIFLSNKWAAFGVGLLGVLVLWIVKAYLADQNFDVPVSSLLASLFGQISTSAVYFLTGITGGLIGGLGGLLGSWTRALSVQNTSQK